jgi:hypothetical protein
MEDSDRELRLFVVETDTHALSRATEIVEVLRGRRKVSGGGPAWSVVYPDVEVAEALRLCDADLGEIDPRWGDVLDFAATPSAPLPEAEFG